MGPLHRELGVLATGTTREGPRFLNIDSCPPPPKARKSILRNKEETTYTQLIAVTHTFKDSAYAKLGAQSLHPASHQILTETP